MTDRDSDGVWRDERRLPLHDLEQAMAAPAGDGQSDDLTGNDAGTESAFGHGPEATEQVKDPTQVDLTDEQRRNRPSTTGRTGPH